MSFPEPPADLSQAADFRQFFESSPELFLVLDASDDHRIVAATDAYLHATMKTREAIVGCPVFVVFPDNPDDPATANHEAFRAALERVRQTGEPEAVPVYQYDLPLPGDGRRLRASITGRPASGRFLPRGATTLPGHKPRSLLCRTEDVTRQVALRSRPSTTRARGWRPPWVQPRSVPGFGKWVRTA